MEEYGHYHDLIEEIGTLMEKYPRISVTGLCNSILGNNIPIITLGEGHTRIIYLGGEAGNDELSPYLLLRFIKDICAMKEEGGAVYGFSAEYILKKYTLTVIPILNPDGAVYRSCGVSESNPLRERVIKINGGSEDFSDWIGNARGVDLRYCYGFDSEGNVEPEAEVGALCNFLSFGTPAELVIAFAHGDLGESLIYYGDGEPSAKIAAAFTQMTGFKRCFFEGKPSKKSLLEWSNSELLSRSFRIEISREAQCQRRNKGQSFSKYLQIRKVLFCAPLLSKIGKIR